MRKKDSQVTQVLDNEIMQQAEIQKLIDNATQSGEEARAKAVQILSKTEFPQQLSELGMNEIKLLTAIWTLGEVIKSPELIRFCKNYLFFMVSKERKGRGEILDIGKSDLAALDSQSRLKRIFSLGGRL